MISKKVSELTTLSNKNKKSYDLSSLANTENKAKKLNLSTFLFTTRNFPIFHIYRKSTYA